MGYSRAVRSGNTIAVTGCVGINADGTYAKTVGEQTARSLAIIRAAIEALGGKLEHVIRTRMYVDRRQPSGKKSPASTAACSAKSARPRRSSKSPG